MLANRPLSWLFGSALEDFILILWHEAARQRMAKHACSTMRRPCGARHNKYRAAHRAWLPFAWVYTEKTRTSWEILACVSESYLKKSLTASLGTISSWKV